MEDVETTAIVKARLQGWIAYIGEQADVPPRAEATSDGRTGPPEPEEPTYALVGELVDDAADHHVPPADAVPKEVVDRVIEQWQTQIADLRGAVEYERERAKQLQQAVEREQMLQAARMNLGGNGGRAPMNGHARPPYAYDDSRAKAVLLWAALVLLCGGLGVLFSLVMNH